MYKHAELTDERIREALPRIDNLIYPRKAQLNLRAWHVGGEPVSLEIAMGQSFTPFAVGDAWGPEWDTSWFHIGGRVPHAWAGQDVVILIRLTCEGREGFTAEGLIYQNGKVVRALNANRHEIEVAKPACGGESFEFYIEAAANVSMPDGRVLPVNSGPCFGLAQAELATVNREAFAFYYDFKVAAQLLDALPASSQRRGELRYALNDALNRLDYTNPCTIGPARAALAEVLSKKNGDTVHRVSAIGHAHIDTAWLWPLRETIRKCARTFSTAIDYMDRYPEYVFACSQAQQYAWMKAHYPSIYNDIRERVQRGQWEPVGSMWVEVDCNLASGESLIRQIVHGKRFFKEEFGYETKDAWIPDVFGYSAALPQIYRGCGIDLFVTQKISWNQFNKFPHHTFLWEGIDGTRIFSHFPPADTYNGLMEPKDLVYNVSNFKEHGRASRSLYLFGYGDGGGGPSIAMLEQARRMNDLDGLPKVKLEKVNDFAQKAKEDARDLPVWVGELYLELHRGTYTTQARNKRGNRKGEFLLHDAEFFDAISLALVPNRDETAADPARTVYDVTGLGCEDPQRHSRALDRAWKLLLLNQFHDIIPGSSIGWVYKDSARDYETITELGQSVVSSSLHTLNSQVDTTGFKKPIQVFNTLNFERKEVIEIAPNKLVSVSVPPSGYIVIDAESTDEQQAASARQAVKVQPKDGGLLVENGLIQIILGGDGLIKSLRDLEDGGREVVAPGNDANLFQIHHDRPNCWDAWDIDLFYKETVENLRSVDQIEILESQPQRVKIRIVRSFGQSRIVQNMIVRTGSKRIDFETEVDWHEVHKLLKVAFPVDIRSQRATYEIQFGHVERPTHYNTSWDMARFEACAQKWADLSEANYGVALLNDCKYGYDIHDNVLRLSLLRSATAPDPTADRGTHRFTYALLPHKGDLRQGRVIEEAYQLNVPVLVASLPVQPGALPAKQSFVETDRPGIVIESIKTADDGNGIIIRFYEAYGSRGPVTLRTALPLQSAYRTDLLENSQASLSITNGSVCLDIRPFEIVTLKLEIAKR